MTPDYDDGLDIPAALRVDKTEQERRNEYNRTHPIESHAGSYKREVSAEEQLVLDRIAAEKKEAERVKRENRMTKREIIANQDRAISDGKVWLNGNWVIPDRISPGEAKRIMRELPTDSMREIFVRDYGHRVPGGVRMPKVKQ